MGTGRRKTSFWVVMGVLFLTSCGGQAVRKTAAEAEVGRTIGSLAEIFGRESIAVDGYGLVGGLRGTGSSECPPNLREYLKQYILAQLAQGTVDVEKLISERTTAVVGIHGMMPPAAVKEQRFDLKVSALAETQTTSLEGGWLYRAELKASGPFGIATKALATAEGPIFLDTIGEAAPDKKAGYVLAGGRILDDYSMTLVLRKPDYLAARRISDMLNTRFGEWTANPASPDVVQLRVPAAYVEQKERFVSIVKAMYLGETPEFMEARAEAFVQRLAASDDKEGSEISLEAIGIASLKKLAALLSSSDEQVRLRAARCMLNIGSDEGLVTLRAIALDRGSSYRIAALEAITAAARRKDAVSVGRILLRDDDFEVRLAAYEQLRRMDDISITRELIGGNFYLEQIAQAQRREIYASRRGQPRIVLFGAPMSCRDNIFVQSASGDVTINAAAGQQYVSLVRKLPNRPKVVELRSSFELADIIRTLCEEPVVEEGYTVRSGLNVSYDTAIGLLRQLCDSGAVAAGFRAGALPEID
ncbi:MAG TPA: flagellar basal body P-ring protein FlgI [Sedimentisphaerales bacterium]|nr:flagellar basal body P-ring protein FlgI [Sedimentisphaerales bacterium]